MRIAIMLLLLATLSGAAAYWLRRSEPASAVVLGVFSVLVVGVGLASFFGIF